MKKLLVFVAGTVLAGSSALATGTRTATLDVTGMDCAVCPIAVRKAIEKVPGVFSVKVDFKTKRAVVLFDQGSP